MKLSQNEVCFISRELKLFVTRPTAAATKPLLPRADADIVTTKMDLQSFNVVGGGGEKENVKKPNSFLAFKPLSMWLGGK